MVGCEGAIAGKPAPTVVLGTVAREWLAVRAPSLASQLLQGVGCSREGMVGFEGAIAGKPAPAGDLVQSRVNGGLLGCLRRQGAWMAGCKGGLQAPLPMQQRLKHQHLLSRAYDAINCRNT